MSSPSRAATPFTVDAVRQQPRVLYEFLCRFAPLRQACSRGQVRWEVNLSADEVVLTIVSTKLLEAFAGLVRAVRDLICSLLVIDFVL